MIFTFLRNNHPLRDELISRHMGQPRNLAGPWDVCTLDIKLVAPEVECLDVAELGKVEATESDPGKPFDFPAVLQQVAVAMFDENFIMPIRVTREQALLLEQSEEFQTYIGSVTGETTAVVD